MINSVYIEITSLCNLKCRYCYNGSKNNELTEIPLSDLQKIVTYCNSNSSDIILSGGEPFLYSEIDSLLKIIKDNDSILFHMVTNGTKVPLNKIIPLKNLRLHISLDSVNEAVNSQTRGSYDYKRVRYLIHRLGELKIPFYVNMVLAHSNMKEIKDFYETVIRNNGIPQFNFIQYQSLAKNNWSDLGLNNFQKIECIKIVDKLNKNYKVKSNQLGCFNMCPLIMKESDISIAIDFWGDIYPCQLLRSKDMKLSNIKELSGLDDLHDKILQLKENLQQRIKNDYDCNKCFLNTMCYRGCPAEAYIKNNHYFASDNNCDIRRWQYLYRLVEVSK